MSNRAATMLSIGLGRRAPFASWLAPTRMGYDATTPKFAAQAIKKAVEMSWKPVHVNGQRWELFGPVITDDSNS